MTDWTRFFLAVALTVLLAATLLLPFIFVSGGHWDAVKELLQITVPAVTGLLGAAVGFYFGGTTNP